MNAVDDGALRVNGVTVAYGARVVVRNLTLPELRAGTITAIVGPNGAGKSTLLRALAGLTAASGTACLGELDLLRAPVALHAQHVAFMPQALPQGVALSVFEGVLSATSAAAGDIYGPASRLRQQHAAVILERVGLTQHAHRSLQQLSGGERQLASLAQALVRQPDLLLLDEPTSALDLRHQVSVMSLVREVADEGGLVLIVVHDLSLAARWADTIVVLTAGSTRAVGTPEEALTADVLASAYGVEARVERCTRGRLQILIDGLATAVEVHP